MYCGDNDRNFPVNKNRGTTDSTVGSVSACLIAELVPRPSGLCGHSFTKNMECIDDKREGDMNMAGPSFVRMKPKVRSLAITCGVIERKAKYPTSV